MNIMMLLEMAASGMGDRKPLPLTMSRAHNVNLSPIKNSSTLQVSLRV